MPIFLIAGLGNIGPEYIGTRHNIGFDVLDALVRKYGGHFAVKRLASLAELKWKSSTLICIKPNTYVNLSGKAVKYWMDKKEIPMERLLVVVDDIALPLSRLRIRPAGSDSGHNGLKSIQESLNSQDYPRLRFGAGNDYPRGSQVDYVLGRWMEAELPLVELKIQKSVEAIEGFVNMGIEWAMNQYNKLELSL